MVCSVAFYQNKNDMCKELEPSILEGKTKKDTEPNKRFAATAVSVRKESKRNECKKGRKYLNDASSILIWAHAFGFLLIYVWGHYMAILYVWNWQRTLKSSCNSNQNANEPKSK